MKSDKAEAGLKAFKDYDYRVECEGKEPGSADPIRVYFQNKRLQNILAVSKRRKLSADTSEFLTARLSRFDTTTAPDLHVLMQPDENTSTTLATYDMPQNALNVALPENDIPCIEYSVVMEPEYMVVSEEKEYQQVQGLCTDPTADSSDDDFQEAPLPDNVLAQLAFG